MLFADQQHLTTALAIIGGLLCLLLFAGVGFLAFSLFRGYERLARRALQSKYADLQISQVPQPGDVSLTYYTYHGLLAWLTETPHHATLPPDEARRLLGRLLRFNLVWGLLTHGAIFVPPWAIVTYLLQRRSIASQELAAQLLAERQMMQPQQAYNNEG